MHEKARKKILKYLRYVLDSRSEVTNPLVYKSDVIDFLNPHISRKTLEEEFNRLSSENVVKVMPSIGRPDQLYYIHREHFVWKA